MKQPAVYIATNNVGTLYIGVTSNIEGRAQQHAEGHGSAFTSKYGVSHIIFVEYADDMETAIAREKQLKGWRREKKIALINRQNPGWQDLFIDSSATLGMTNERAGGGLIPKCHHELAEGSMAKEAAK